MLLLVGQACIISTYGNLISTFGNLFSFSADIFFIWFILIPLFLQSQS